MAGAAAMAVKNGAWEAARSRERVSELVNYVQHSTAELEQLECGEDDALSDGGGGLPRYRS
jgi:hypothetical protein